MDVPCQTAARRCLFGAVHDRPPQSRHKKCLPTRPSILAKVVSSSVGEVPNTCIRLHMRRRGGETRPRDNGDAFDRPGESQRHKRIVAEGHSWCQDILGDIGIGIVRRMAMVLPAGVQTCRHLLFEHRNSLSVKMCGQNP